MWVLDESGKSLAEIVRSLSSEELIALRYFVKYKSVGEILASRELRALGVRNPSRVLARLASLGLVKRGVGCYTISREVLEEVRQGKVSI